MKNSLIVLFSSVALFGCASWPQTSRVDPPPANLRQPCPQLPLLAEKTGSGILRWSREVVRLYNDCAARHDATIEAWPK